MCAFLLSLFAIGSCCSQTESNFFASEFLEFISKGDRQHGRKRIVCDVPLVIRSFFDCSLTVKLVSIGNFLNSLISLGLPGSANLQMNLLQTGQHSVLTK